VDNSTFLQRYKLLNAQQKQAVEHIDGPLLVIAGPGTGKTELLSFRIANILQQTDAYADNLLCLTFTNKAADNMKQRLLNLIGPDAQNINVKTFHSLAAEIMNRYPEYFWKGARLTIAPEAAQLRVTQQVLNSLPDDHPLTLKFAGQFTLIDDTVKSINLAKEAGLTPNKLRAIIKANLAYIDAIEPMLSEIGSIVVSKKSVDRIAKIVSELPGQSIDDAIRPLSSLQTILQESFGLASQIAGETGKNTSISRWKSQCLQKQDGVYGLFNERKRNEWWLGVADAYESYRQKMHSKGYYDYADMLVEVVSQIEQHSDLRANLQEQFQYVLIDEFQDTNAAQLRLAHLIADHQDITEPNLMAVGDDDQSIFKFQGAELSNMLGFTRQYKTAKIVVLTENYRSTQEVLDCAGEIIQHAQFRLVNRLPDLSKELRAVSPPSSKSHIIHQSFRSREEQLSGLASQAAKYFSEGKTVAILARKHSSLRDMAALLHQQGTPISYEQSNNILEQPAIEQLYLILKLVVEIKKGSIDKVNELLSLLLRHPMWGIRPKVLWAFAIEQQKKYDWLSGLMNSDEEEMQSIYQWLNWLCGLSATEPLAVVTEYILGLRENDILTSPLHKYFFADHELTETYIETLSAVQLLRSLVSEFRSFGISKVEDFVKFVSLMMESNKIISDNSPFVSGEETVELLTVYKAKGLEFDVVIVVDAVDSDWSPRTRGRLPPANLPLRSALEDADDYVRLMYVAATRAKHSLIFGSYYTSMRGDSIIPSSSISEVSIVKQKPIKKHDLVNVLERSLRWPRLQQYDEKALLLPKLENYSLNVSNLINFLDVSSHGPEYFKERNLLQLPSSKSPATAMGSAIHRALEEAQLATNLGNFKFANVISSFNNSLLNEGLPEEDYKKKLNQGKRVLERFINEYSWHFANGAKPEYKVVDVLCGNAKLSGTLDVLDQTGNITLITDYKTGRPLTSLSLKSGQDGIKAWKHKLQLIFYALLVGLDPSIHTESETHCQMVYVEAQSKDKIAINYVPSEEEVTRLTKLIAAVWKQIQTLNFPDISKYPNNLEGIIQFENDLINDRI
jgi:DNA helicase-2/ATP-dependent DNA helicase PcrA